MRPTVRLASTEAAIAELGQRQVALWMPDEFGTALHQIYTDDRKRGIEELLLTLYSGQTYRYVTLARGEEVISNLDLSVFGATTPDSFGSSGGRAIGSGLLPRFGIIYPSWWPEERAPVAETDVHRVEYAALLARMRGVLMMCSYPGANRMVTMTPAALAEMAPLGKEFGAVPLTARLVTATYKVAALVALGDARAEVTAADAHAAVVITRRWAAGAKNLRRFLGRPSADVAAMEQVDAAREELRAMIANRIPGSDGRVSLASREVARRLRLPHATIKRICNTLELTGDVILVSTDAGEEWHVAL